MPPCDRREIFPSDQRRAGDTNTIAPGDRREIFTGDEFFARCYQSAETMTLHRSRWPVRPLPEAHPRDG